MLTLYRRHKPTCSHFADGRGFHHCRCAIWTDGVLDGKEFRQSLRTRDWTRASQMVRQMEADQRVIEVHAAATLDSTWIRIHEEFLNSGLKSETIRKYKHLEKQMKAFAEKRGLKLLKDFNLDSLSQFQSTWKDGSRSAGKKIEKLRRFFAFAMDRGWVDSNLAKKMTLPKVTVAPTMPLEDEELQKLYAKCDKLLETAGKSAKLNAARIKPLLLVMRYAGLRISDAVNLTKDQVEASAIKVSQTKTGVVVRVPVSPVLIQELAKTPMVTRTRYFWTGQGKLETAVKDYQAAIKKVFDLAGVVKGESNAMSHRLRDTFAVSLLKTGTPMARLSVLLGHTSVATTQKHYSPWDESQQQLAEADVTRSWLNDPMMKIIPGTEKVQISKGLPN